ncbi:MAG: hypothetical protein PVF37_06940, partial [Desulfobacterales bacterium]
FFTAGSAADAFRIGYCRAQFRWLFHFVFRNINFNNIQPSAGCDKTQNKAIFPIGKLQTTFSELTGVQNRIR